jgi:imidazolonepropionase-like amidohydrolase
MNETAVPQLRAYSEAGGQILFGTDVGYIRQFDTSEEFLWMSRAGMNFQQVLASLTTNPARLFGYMMYSGRIAKGDYFDRINAEGLKRYLVKRLESLGQKVTLEPRETAA